MTEAIGMMEGAFFVSRGEILSWVNDLLKLNTVKIEQTASGAIACQILDILYPEAVPMQRVKWAATLEHEFVNNWKIVQQVFIKKKISKVIEVEKLSKGKYQESLEFMQWLKRYYDLNANPTIQYDPIARRKKANLPNVHEKRGRPSKVSGGSVPPSENRNSAALVKKKEEEKIVKKALPPRYIKKSQEESKKLAEECKKERDLYCFKLKGIEELIAYHEKEKTGIDIIPHIKKILNATEEDDIAINAKGDVIINGAEEEKDQKSQPIPAALGEPGEDETI